MVPYNAEMIDTKNLTLGIEGTKLDKQLQDQLRRQEEDPNYMMLPGGSFARVFMDDKTNELIVLKSLKELLIKENDDRVIYAICQAIRVFSEKNNTLSVDINTEFSDFGALYELNMINKRRQ